MTWRPPSETRVMKIEDSQEEIHLLLKVSLFLVKGTGLRNEPPLFFLSLFSTEESPLWSEACILEEKAFSRSTEGSAPGKRCTACPASLHHHDHRTLEEATTEPCEPRFPSRWEALFSMGHYWLWTIFQWKELSPYRWLPSSSLIQSQDWFKWRLWSEDFPVAFWWLRPPASTAGASGSILGQGTKWPLVT